MLGITYILYKILLLYSEKYVKFTDNINSKPYILNDTFKLNDNYLVQFED